MPKFESKRDIALWYAEKFIGLPYIWGGDDPIKGFDCSGLVIEVNRGAGNLPPAGDWSADALAKVVWKNKKRLLIGEIIPGCCLFWADATGKIFHVEIVLTVLGMEVFTIGASGGGSATPDAEAASAQNAYVKVRKRTGWAIALDPFS